MRVSSFEFRVSGFGFRVLGFGFRVSGFGFRVSGFGFRVQGFWFRVWDCLVDSVEARDEGLLGVRFPHVDVLLVELQKNELRSLAKQEIQLSIGAREKSQEQPKRGPMSSFPGLFAKTRFQVS